MLIVIMVVLLLLTGIRVGQISTKDYSKENIEVIREKYVLRNLMWSGIFPLYGGFIDDPHYLFRTVMKVPEYLPVLGSESSKYQLIQVNPFFENRTTENLLAMEINGVTYEYKLKTPQDYSYYSVEREPDSIFLYSQSQLYFILRYNYEEAFLIYEINEPYNENKLLDYQWIDLTGKEENELAFDLSREQIIALTQHTDFTFYDLYTQYINKSYIDDLLQTEMKQLLSIPLYYGSSLNINRFDLKGKATSNEYQQQLDNLYEFSNSIKDISFGYLADNQKAYFELQHNNYYDFKSIGNSFDESEFLIQEEHKRILIDSKGIDDLLHAIKSYKVLRESNIETTTALFDRRSNDDRPLFEVITFIDNQAYIKREYPYFYIFPTSLPQERMSLNSTEYVIPVTHTDEQYLFIIEFYGQFSLKFSLEDLLKLEQVLLQMKEESNMY